MSLALHPFTRSFSTMGCPAELCVYAASATQVARALEIAVGETHRLDQKYSHYRNNSMLARLLIEASTPGGAKVDAETAALLNFAACEFEKSSGCFDITAGRLTRLWQESTDLPTNSELQQALSLTGWGKVLWDGTHLQLPRGMQFDLGGIVKEYAADRVALLLREAGFTSGYIDLGGDLHILGAHPDGRPWKVGIRHPRHNGAMACIDVYRGGLASSGDYERFRLIEGRRYSHIIDARSGWPVNGMTSVSVLAPSCLVAGAVSTLAMLQGKQASLRFLNQTGLHWLCHDGERVHSDIAPRSQVTSTKAAA